MDTSQKRLYLVQVSTRDGTFEIGIPADGFEEADRIMNQLFSNEIVLISYSHVATLNL